MIIRELSQVNIRLTKMFFLFTTKMKSSIDGIQYVWLITTIRGLPYVCNFV